MMRCTRGLWEEQNEQRRGKTPSEQAMHRLRGQGFRPGPSRSGWTHWRITSLMMISPRTSNSATQPKVRKLLAGKTKIQP
eukprot:scaffold102156_cov18-Tisochrysis_lutea.AAC.1